MLALTMLFLAPYFHTMTSTFMNTTSYLNQTAFEMIQDEWPSFQNKTSMAWERFQNDPNNWILAYPITLLLGALLIYSWGSATPRYAEDEEDQEDYTDNILARRKRNNIVFTITDNGQRKHRMVLRSMGAARLYELE